MPSKEKRFEELKSQFEREIILHTFYDFHALLGQAQHHAGKPQLRLVPYQKDKLLAVYKEKKLSVLPEIIREMMGTPPYPLNVMKEAIQKELELWPQVKKITDEQIKQVYIAVMNAELTNDERQKGVITSAARDELSKILSGGRGN